MTKVVSRICSPRCSAITAPSIASQRNRIEANSSDQVSGRRISRLTTPANSTSVSTSTITAASTSTERAMPSSTARNRGEPVGASFAAAIPGRPIEMVLAELRGHFFQDGPGFRTVFALPFLVELGFHERLAERLRIHLVELHAGLFEVGLQRVVLRKDFS